MSSPRILLSIAAFAAALCTPAFANDDTSTAIAACRTAVGAELSVAPEALQVDRVDSRGRTIRVRLKAHVEAGRPAAAECTYVRNGGTTTVAVAQPRNGGPSTQPAR